MDRCEFYLRIFPQDRQCLDQIQHRSRFRIGLTLGKIGRRRNPRLKFLESSATLLLLQGASD